MATAWSEIEADFQKRVKDTVSECETKAQSCAVRASNQLRNAALSVLRGARSGKRYKKPGSSSRYTASAPGEPPAVRTGTLRRSWGLIAKGDSKKGSYTAGIYTDVKYANYLEEGTGKMSARPYRDAIIEKAQPKIESIFNSLTK
ncbi:MAG: HK97 gp10 family phage protein [Lachnospiraceae bacterium]|nr:HK97 gp10 family phage protein [Lachnospiraceae bacterium]MCD8196129.1 HK97 gp10 family phage protein [Lachnospiraceae bacterium]